MRITLIGMSNVGKSYWSEKLEKSGFKRFCCDDMIEKKLEPILKKEGYSGIHDMSKWMGQPYEEQYDDNARKYIFHETEVLKEILDYIKKNKGNNIVVDTTGSVIHTNNIILHQIKMLTDVIYLKTSSSEVEKMLKSYIEHPKPVFWSNQFQKGENESDMKALKRCYPKLISFRRLLYNRFADKTIYGEKLRYKNINENDFIKKINEA
ncbi:hypothetical protein HOD20_09520 [archaeon]|jgi:shikimate kinase|nr:hypothetical protein [archaeon]MBT4352748.1 hypothetical protein [archaeon]MBT4648151.1 hypothetical protein [archaeon]MBT6822431.1 hypothetical protein [archaeon]MBT7391900.1 hypothetical protein [archaeon]